MAYFAGDAGQHTVEGDAGLLAMAMSLSEAGHFLSDVRFGSKADVAAMSELVR